MGLRRIRIDLAYDGTDFVGWQWQTGQRSVQQTAESALTRLAGGVPVRLRAAGRTDSGVHARQQVADGLIDSRLDDAALARALSKILPPDLRPTALRTVPDGFNSMRDAVRKSYRYRLDRSPYGDPLVGRFALHHPYVLDVDTVREALRRLLGRRDWSGFADSRCRVDNRVRNLERATYRERERIGWFTFCADGFLTYMVRNLVGTLLEVGAGRRSLESIEQVLETGDRTLAAATAPARGLCLWRVEYDEARSGGEAP